MATITRMLTSWQLALRAERRAAKTIETYSLGVRQFSEWHGDAEVTDVTRDHVRAFLVHLEQDMEPSSVRTRYGGLRQFFVWLVDEGELDRSPMDTIKPPRVDAPPILVLTEDQAKILVKITHGRDFLDRRDEAIIRLFLDTGMRLGAMLGLGVDDIDLGDRIAYVKTKGDKYHSCPFGFATAKALDDYLRARDRHELAHLGALWLGQRGRLQRNGARQMLYRRGRAAGIEGLHPHALRHTFADHWLANGGQEGDLMELAGWKSRTMLDRYARRNRANRARSAHDRLALGDRL